MPQKELTPASSLFQNRGLFSDHFLQERLPEWKEWKVTEELEHFRSDLLALYDVKKQILPGLNEAQTEVEFIKPVLDLLGYANSYIVQASTKIGQQTNRPDYALFPDASTKDKAYAKIECNDYAQCIGIADAKYWGRELDLAKSSERDTFTNQNPSFQIIGYLTGTKQNWGILTNGRHWRLYSTKSHLPLGNYYQVDLVQLLEEAPAEALKYFYVFFRKEALLRVDSKSFLDRVLEGSEEYAVELEADIKDRAYDVVELLCRGFAAAVGSNKLNNSALKAIYDNSLTLLYRLLFVFYAEARDLLPLTKSASYRDNYSLRKLTHDVDEIFRKGYELSSSSTQYYHYLQTLFSLINAGDPKLDVPEYNGGLFNPREHPFLEEHTIPDSHLVKAIHQLARIHDRELKREVAVDYNTLSERHLGSIYEGLLEFRPQIAPHDLVVIREKGSIKYAPASKQPGKKVSYHKGELYLVNDKGERKASGSYYTPEYIVNYIVENTLDPLVKEAHEKVKALKPEVDKEIAKWQKLKEQKTGLEPVEKYGRAISEEREKLLAPYLSIKVLDPAMGSGHFLARATDFLAEAIATDPFIESQLELAEESELTYYRRRVVESCIYGVDLNPLAVELAKLTLWLTTMAKSKPLSFLNHHLRVGNSLIGARIADLDEVPKAKSKKKAVDLSRAPVQLGLFQTVFNQKLYDLLQNRALIAKLPTETLEDVHNKQKWEEAFERNIERFRTLADIWTSTFFGNEVAWDSYNTLIERLQSPDEEWQKLIQKRYVQKALESSGEKRFFHWELEFPEVFYDEKGSRKADAGFDAVIGNPPYVSYGLGRTGTLSSDLEKYYRHWYTDSAEYKISMYALFMEKSHQLAQIEGYSALIVPDSFLTGSYFSKIRKLLLKATHLEKIVLFTHDFWKSGDVGFPTVYISRKRDISNECLAEIRYAQLGNPEQLLQGFEYKKINQVKTMNNPGLRIYLIGDSLEDQITEKISRISKPLITHITLHHGVRSKVGRDKVISATRLDDRWKPALISSAEVTRFAINPEENFIFINPKLLFSGGWDARLIEQEKLLLRRTGDSLISAIDNNNFYHTNALIYGVRSSSQEAWSLQCLASILNSHMFVWLYRLLSMKSGRTLPQVEIDFVHTLPIRAIKFTTPDKERQQLLAQGKELYREYLVSKEWDKILSFVSDLLPLKEDGTSDTESEHSDVIHDLLAFLAEEMTRLNREKQSRIKAFLSWLEKEIIKGSTEDQKNKTKIKNFHEGTLEELMDVLKKNRAVPDPCPSKTWNTIEAEFSAAVTELTPLKDQIAATDRLIDRIVYRLYNLTDDEIAIVEGTEHISPLS